MGTTFFLGRLLRSTLRNFQIYNTALLIIYKGSPSGSAVKNLPVMQEMHSVPGLGRSPKEEMAIHSSILARRYHGQRNLAGYNP